MNGGERIAEALAAQGVRVLFTLCGGHISPILVGAKARGIRVVDVVEDLEGSPLAGCLGPRTRHQTATARRGPEVIAAIGVFADAPRIADE